MIYPSSIQKTVWGVRILLLLTFVWFVKKRMILYTLCKPLSHMETSSLDSMCSVALTVSAL